MRGWAWIEAGILVAGWANLAAAEPDLSPAALIERLRRAPPALSGREERAEAWRGLIREDGLRVRCGTPLALALRHERSLLPSSLQAPLDRLLSPPARARQVARSAALEIRVRGALPASLPDDNANGVVDPFERALEEGGRALRHWSESGGWLPPAEGGAGRAVTVTLEDLPEGLEGLTLVENEPDRTFEEDATAAIVVSRRLLERPADLVRAVTHQLAHAVLWAYSHRESPAWQEASAVALEIEARRDASAFLDSFNERLQKRTVSLRDPRLGLAEGAGLWALFLDLSHPATGSPPLRRLWEELAAVPGDNLTEAMEGLFPGEEGSAVGAEIATFLAWTLFTGEQDDGHHFPFGAALKSAPADATHETFPATGPPAGLTLEPWSGSVVTLQPPREPGGLRLQFQGEEGGRWSVLALLATREEGALFYSRLEVDASGKAALAFPARALRSVALIVANSAPPGAPAAGFSYSAWHDPLYPFELAGLSAEPATEGVGLSWTTDGETGLIAWNVYRSLSPSGGFVKVNQMPILAGGEVREPLRYLFFDSDTEPGKKYYYRLEGLTAGGFAERTITVSARAERRH